MEERKKRTIELLMEHGALRFGEYRLKSGRISPYFVNLGDVADGRGISELANLMADKIKADVGLDSFDALFGPAYKGIVIASAAASCLYRDFGVVKGFAYDRKETKSHGEGGGLVGVNLKRGGRRILVVDDVITDGKTKIDTIDRLERETEVVVVGILVVVDRMERDANGKTFSRVIEERCGVTLFSLITIIDIIEYLEAVGTDRAGISAEAFGELKKSVDYSYR